MWAILPSTFPLPSRSSSILQLFIRDRNPNQIRTRRRTRRKHKNRPQAIRIRVPGCPLQRLRQPIDDRRGVQNLLDERRRCVWGQAERRDSRAELGLEAELEERGGEAEAEDLAEPTHELGEAGADCELGMGQVGD